MIKLEYKFETQEELDLFLKQLSLGKEKYFLLNDMAEALRKVIKHDLISDESYKYLREIQIAISRIVDEN